MMELGVSIVLCTYNGANRIIQTLKSLLLQEGIDCPCELLVIDNNSTDKTVELINKIWRSEGYPFDLRLVVETLPGTSAARTRGIAEAKFRYLLFCDDDNWLSIDYVATAYKLIRKSEQIAAIGGKGEQVFDKDFIPPSWAKKFERWYGCGEQGPIDGDTTDHKMCLYTAGTILDLVWVNKLKKNGFVSSLKGRVGTNLVAGEDTELTFALKLIGASLHYSSLLTFKHFMPAQRMQWSYLKKLVYAAGFSDFILSSYPNFFMKKEVKRPFYSFFSTLFHYLILILKIKYRKVGEGNKNIVQAAKLKGYLMAHLFAYRQYKHSVSIFKTLLRSVQKQQENYFF